MNLFAVFSVLVVIAISIFERNLIILSLITFVPGYPVPMEIKHLIKGFRSPVSKYYIFEASPLILSTRLFAPRAPSTNWHAPIDTGSKKPVAAKVIRAALHMVARMSSSSGKL